MAGPTIPTQFQDIDWTQRAQVLNEVGTLINAYITYWAATVTPVSVPDPGSGGTYSFASTVLNAYMTALNAVNTEFTLGVTPTPVIIDSDFGHFTSAINQILTYLTALDVAKP